MIAEISDTKGNSHPMWKILKKPSIGSVCISFMKKICKDENFTPNVISSTLEVTSIGKGIRSLHGTPFAGRLGEP